MNVKKLTFGAAIAAIYAVLTIFLAPISYGPLQCRISEALCILPVLSPTAVWGLFVGCLVANIFTGSLVDVIFGSLTTLIAAILTYKTRKKLLPSPQLNFGIFYTIIDNQLEGYYDF